MAARRFRSSGACADLHKATRRGSTGKNPCIFGMNSVKCPVLLYMRKATSEGLPPPVLPVQPLPRVSTRGNRGRWDSPDGLADTEFPEVSMARITVEDCLDKVDNRFQLVMVASKRARQIQIMGRDPMVSVDNDKPTVLALREIAEGLVTREILNEKNQPEPQRASSRIEAGHEGEETLRQAMAEGAEENAEGDELNATADANAADTKRAESAETSDSGEEDEDSAES